MFGALAQLGARYIRIVEVVGSNPICSIKSGNSALTPIPGFFFIYAGFSKSFLIFPVLQPVLKLLSLPF